MALIKWDDPNKQDDPFNPAPVKQVASVQSSAWQPAPSGADAPAVQDTQTPQDGGVFNQSQPQQTANPQPQSDNYLLSDQKAQVDEEKRQHDLQVAEARRQDAARQAAAAEAAQAAQFEQGNVQTQQGQKLDINALKNDNGWKKYYNDAFQKEKSGLDFWGRLMDNGQASKRAEVMARNHYANELINQAYDENGNTIDPNAAMRAKGVTAYNSALAQDNSAHSNALARAIGASKDNQGGGFWNRVKDAIEAEKQMNIYDAFAGANDGQKTDIHDLGRFGGGLLQGFGTMIPIGLKDIKEAATGHGTSAQTGFEGNLTAGERVGRGIAGGLDVVTPFVGGSGKLLDSLTTKVAEGTATMAEKSMLEQVARQVLLPAIEQGGIGAAQAGGEYFGNGNTLLDEHGKLDMNKVKEFAKQTGESGAMGFAGGALMSGGSMGIKALRSRGADVPSLTPEQLMELETANSNVGASELATMHPVPDSNSQVQSLQNGEVAPIEPQQQVADGTAQPETALNPDGTPVDKPVDSPVASGEPTLTPVDNLTPDMLPTGEYSPAGADVVTTDTPALDSTPQNSMVNPDPTAPPALNPDGIATPDVTPSEMATPDVTPVTDKTAPQAADTAPVADGVPVSDVTPVRDQTAPVGEQVRQLQDARAGTSQAEEAAINQELQQTHNNTPAYMRRAPKTVGAADAQYKLTGETTLPDSTFSADAHVDPMAGSDSTDTPAFYRKNADTKVPELTDKIAALDKRIEMIKSATDQVVSFQDKQRIAAAYKVSREIGDRMRQYIADKNKSGSADRETALKQALAERNQLANERSKYQMAKDQGLPDLQQPEFSPVTNVPKVDNVPTVTDHTPVQDGNLPDGMGDANPATSPDGKPLGGNEFIKRFAPKLADNKDVKQSIADAAGMSKDVAAPLDEILQNGNVNPKRAARITEHFNNLEKQLRDYNAAQDKIQSAYTKDGTDGLSTEVSKEGRRAGREIGITMRRLNSEIKKLEGSRDMKVALIHGMTEMIGTRNANVLTSAGLIERNVMQEITGNVKLAVKNPIKMIRSTFQNGNILKDTAKTELSHWKDAPRNPLDALHYVVGNVYRTAMTPTTALANTRRGAIRDELTKWAVKELEGRDISTAEAHKLAGAAGNEMEALVNTGIGVDNGMTNRGQFMEALDSWKKYMRSGDSGDKADYLAKVEQHTSLADKMINGLGKEDQTKYRALKAMGNLIFPFVRTAGNLAKTAVQQDLNPFAKSVLDEIRADQHGGTVNAINTIKSKLVDYGIMGGAAALASSGALVYNDGDQIDKPKGWSLHTGGNNYVPVRATSVELPVAMAGTAFEMSKDIAAGKARDWKYYAGMITGSLPYIDQFNQATGVVDSAMNANDSNGDGGYAAKSYAVNTIKSFVPGSNNGVQAYAAGKEGKSLDAKTVYDKNFGTWLKNAIQKNYDPNFYDGLKTSRDNAGRTRTVDNQGVVSNKTINDPNTAEFNTRVTDLVNYGRENGLGQNTQDMFNTYDTGKNNNFKSIQDAITFIDAPTMNGKASPDNAKKLEKNGKLAGLSQQMRDGFFGDQGDALLQLDGQDLKSDASVPNKAGTKNSKLPISMQSIKNAVAQTDLSKDDSDKLYAISNQGTDLYNRLHNKEITYDQYSAAKADLGQQETSILSGSKNYAKMVNLFDELDHTGFFKPDGLGATRSGQTYLWNSLNALLGSKGATPAAEYATTGGNGFTPWGHGGGTGRSATNKPGDRGNTGIKWTPVGNRQMAGVQSGGYTPVNIKVKLGNEIKKDRTQNYSDRSF